MTVTEFVSNIETLYNLKLCHWFIFKVSVKVTSLHMYKRFGSADGNVHGNV